MKSLRQYVPIAILFTLNLLNYMDRCAVSGVLPDIQSYYGINDAQGGLIQTVFVVFYIFLSPTCGFLGDRHNRKWIIIVGMSLWSTVVFSCTWIPSNLFWIFLLLRGMVAVGESSYAVVSPSMISDLYSGPTRSKMLMIFFSATPLGCGCGFVVGALVTGWTGQWQWGVRISSLIGVLTLILLALFVTEPERELSEKESAQDINYSYLEDLRSLLKNPTYILSTFGYCTFVFCMGTINWFIPSVIEHKDAWQLGLNSTEQLPESIKGSVNMIFGIVTCVAGLFGVALGTMISSWMSNGTGLFRYIQTKRSDAIVCCLGAVIAVPSMFLAIFLLDKSMPTAYIMIFICTTGLSFNWATNIDMLMSVVIPPRRNTANALQILMSHLLGDGSGPYILGAISDAIRGDDDTPYGHFHSLSTAFYLADGLLVLGAILYAISAFTVLGDQRKVVEETGSQNIMEAIDESHNEKVFTTF